VLAEIRTLQAGGHLHDCLIESGRSEGTIHNAALADAALQDTSPLRVIRWTLTVPRRWPGG
jgi:hypothetical protein